MKAFECRMCGECCYGEGGIVVSSKEVDSIARFLDVTSQDFVSDYCEERHGRCYIRTGSDGFCIFFDPEAHCRIHPVKPKRCVAWPFYAAIISDRENWELAKDACPGINRNCSFEDFVRASKK